LENGDCARWLLTASMRGCLAASGTVQQGSAGPVRDRTGDGIPVRPKLGGLIDAVASPSTAPR
jgi:hypothetical protein